MKVLREWFKTEAQAQSAAKHYRSIGYRCEVEFSCDINGDDGWLLIVQI